MLPFYRMWLDELPLQAPHRILSKLPKENESQQIVIARSAATWQSPTARTLEIATAFQASQ